MSCGLDQRCVIKSDVVTNETASPCLASLVPFIAKKIKLLIITKSKSFSHNGSSKVY